MRGFLVSTGDADTWILDLDPPPIEAADRC